MAASEHDHTAAGAPPASTTSGERPGTERRAWELIKRTWTTAWDGNLFSEAAEGAYWQTLSFFPLLLGLLGLLGYLGDWFGQQVVTSVQNRIIGFSSKIFASEAVNSIIAPTIHDLLTSAQGEVASVGFLISLYAGSSAVSSFVDAITVAHGQYGIRPEVWQRFYAMFLYLIGLILAVVGLPLLALGPNYLPRVFPDPWEPTVAAITGYFYYPVIAVLLILALATLYKMALPRKLPWHRGVPGATLAMVIAVLASVGLRIYLATVTQTGYTYGALAAPIAFLFMAFFIGLAIVFGAYFNAAIQYMWPAKPTRRERRSWRRLELVRAREREQAPQREDAPEEGEEGEDRGD